MDGTKENNSLMGYKNIKIAIYIFYITQIFIFIRGLVQVYGYDFVSLFALYVPNMGQILSKAQVVELSFYMMIYAYFVVFISFFSMVFIVYKTSQGRQWAKVLLVVSCLLSYIFILISGIYTFFVLQKSLGAFFIFSVFVSFIEIYALVLLLDKKTTHLFK